MSKEIATLQQFEVSLNAAQRAFFIQRERDHEDQFQTLLRDAGRALGIVGGRLSELTTERLARSTQT